MLDKSIPYKNILMRIDHKDLLKITEPVLPEGYHFRFFGEGDEIHWARIETSVLEFDSESAAMAYFVRDYLPYLDELKRRCIFIINPDGLPVATTTAWFADRKAGYQASIHWVSVCPDQQGRGLGRAVVQKALAIFPILDPREDAWLHTQTWSHVAVRLYHSLGFDMVKTSQFMTTGKTPLQQNDFAEAMEVLKNVYDARFWQELADTAK
jgi:GNAT superfamily N-acetyltransferase